MNIFISYSHADESYRKLLDTQLSILKRNNIITSWSDEKIVPGQEWKHVIDKALENAEIILLLISSDFLNSDYCYEQEMSRAIEKHHSGDVIVVPIIIRPCDWKETLFGKLQALPKNAKAVSTWENQDEAWLDVITGLKASVQLANKKMASPIIQEKISSNAISKEFSDWLNDTEIELRHRRADKVFLDDVFVLPDLKMLDDDMDRMSRSVKANEVFKKGKWSLVVGDEQSGKTSLCKFYFKELINSNCWPIFVRGEEIKNSNILPLIKIKSKEQYCSEFDYEHKKGKVIIIDNFASSKLNKKHQNKLISNLKNIFDKIILVSIDSYQYVVPDIESLDGFSHYEIMSFGYIKRTELIEKWVSIGFAEELDETALYSEVDDVRLKVEALTRGGILPSKPIFLLSLLQMFETVTPHKVDLTSYGHCYQYLIYQALEKARVKNSEIDTYINFLTELGFAQFNNKKMGLNASQIEHFYNHYEENYLSIVDKEKIINDLIKSGILVRRNELISFKYSYIYYFFAAKKLAESFSNNGLAKENIQDLLRNLHREDCANIIIFITHHSKDDWVLDEIQICLMELFDEHPEARLDKTSLEFMIDFLNEIPELVIEHRKVDDERKKHDSNLDNLEQSVSDSNNKNQEIEPTDILAKINKTFKGVEIIGQIIRNRHGSLSKDKLEQLVTQAYSVGLRFLEFFLKISDSSKEEIVKLIGHCLKENPSITNEQLEKEARSIFMLLTYGAIYGVLRKISMSVGSKEAEQIYKRLEDTSPSPAVKLINQAIYLQFNKKLDLKKVKLLADEFKQNPTCERILKEIVIQHIYMFPVDYQQKQQIAEILKITVAKQVKLGSQKNFKV